MTSIKIVKILNGYEITVSIAIGDEVVLEYSKMGKYENKKVPLGTGLQQFARRAKLSKTEYNRIETDLISILREKGCTSDLPKKYSTFCFLV